MKKTIYLSGFSIYGFVSISIILVAGLIYDVEEVGILSFIVAIQYFISQFTGLGIHYSALFYESKPDTKEKFSNYYLNVVITSFIMSLCVYLFYNFIIFAPLF